MEAPGHLCAERAVLHWPGMSDALALVSAGHIVLWHGSFVGKRSGLCFLLFLSILSRGHEPGQAAEQGHILLQAGGADQSSKVAAGERAGGNE